MRAVLILNPTSGESSLATNHSTVEELQERIISALQRYQIAPEVRYTTPEDFGTGLAKQAAAEGVEIVIAAGGDGTLHSVATGLIGTQTALGIVPAGTMNNIANSLKIPEDVEQACEIIVCGTTSQIDVGEINGHIFLEVAGIGLEAAIFPAAEEFKSKGLGSTLHALFSGMRTLVTFQPTRFTFSFDGKRRRHYKAVQISICNSPFYGAHLQFAPHALMNDGLLDILIYRKFSNLKYIFYALFVSQGLRRLTPRISHRKVKTLYVDAETPIEIHADGEQIGHTPATITIHPGVLCVRVPQKVAFGPNIDGAVPKQRITKKERETSNTIKKHESKQVSTREEKGPLNVK